MTTYQSRWGHHPSDYEGYLKLRRLHRAYWEGRRLIAKWNRWNAKLPKNRTQPEPVVPAVLREVCASPLGDLGELRLDIVPLGIQDLVRSKLAGNLQARVHQVQTRHGCPLAPGSLH